jgi:NAD(P)-dependent dehydrogenase (short-subunit alcohol dehydrogenase family)
VPGTIATAAWQERVDRNPNVFEDLKPWYPLGRVGTPKDIADAAIFLISEDSQWISGSELVVDGGLLAGYAPMFRTVEGSD